MCPDVLRKSLLGRSEEEDFLDIPEIQEILGSEDELEAALVIVRSTFLKKALEIEETENDLSNQLSFLEGVALSLEAFCIEYLEEEKLLWKVQQGLATAAMIFEYLGDIANSNSAVEYYLHSAITYSLGAYEANSEVIGNRLTNKLSKWLCNSEIRAIETHFDNIDSVKTVIAFFAREWDKIREIEIQKTDQDDPWELLRSFIKFWYDIMRKGENLSFVMIDRAIKQFAKERNGFGYWLASSVKRVSAYIVKRSSRKLLSEFFPSNSIVLDFFCDPEEGGVIELWTSEVEAIEKGLLKNTSTNYILSMPTSAGKTFLGKLVISQFLETHDEETCFYVAPTRALCSQITREFEEAKDIGIFGALASIPLAYEESAAIEEILWKNSRIFILTPEKLDLMIRAKDKRLEKCGLMIFDEIHNIGEGKRGLRYELVISKSLRLLKEKGRVILISAVLPRASLPLLALWLHSDNESILDIPWRPTRLLEGIAIPNRQGTSIRLRYPHAQINIPEVAEIRSRQRGEIAAKLAIKFAKNLGPVIVFCTTKPLAQSMAKKIFEDPTFNDIEVNSNIQEKREQLAAKIEQSLGSEFRLSLFVKAGVAYHHAALPESIKNEIERLASEEAFQIICCTSTLAEGINMPFQTVVFHGLERWTSQGPVPISLAEFFNIEGRAGRALRETEGQSILITPLPLHYIHPSVTFPPLESRLEQIIQTISSKLEESTDFGVLMEEIQDEELGVLNSELFCSLTTQEIEDLLANTYAAHRQQKLEPLIRYSRSFQTWSRTRPLLNEFRQEIIESGIPPRKSERISKACHEFTTLIEGPDLPFRNQKNEVEYEILYLFLKLLSSQTDMHTMGQSPFHEQCASIAIEWVKGGSIVEIFENTLQSVRKTEARLLNLSNYLQNEISSFFSWYCSLSIRILRQILVKLDIQLDPEFELLPLYLKYGVNSPAAILLSLTGCSDRQLLNNIGVHHVLRERFSGNNWAEIFVEIVLTEKRLFSMICHSTEDIKDLETVIRRLIISVGSLETRIDAPAILDEPFHLTRENLILGPDRASLRLTDEIILPVGSKTVKFIIKLLQNDFFIILSSSEQKKLTIKMNHEF